jgi:SAM-dependent MidA family methyltransferase
MPMVRNTQGFIQIHFKTISISMTLSPLELADSHPALCEAIAQRIASSPQQHITFAEFMDLALYHPQYGYYVAQTQPLQEGMQAGIQSDFFTSPHLGADFGELLAEQFAQMWQLLDRPYLFTLVEMGAGQGLIVQDVLRYLHRHHFECFEALEYIVIEKSLAMVAVQQERLQKLTRSWGHLSWKTWDEILPNSIIGCCFSNELVDAFPVHQIAIANGILQEIYVAAGDLFTEAIAAPSTPKLAEYFDLIGLEFPADRYPQPYRSEVNLAALDWITTVADRLKTGYLLTIDYGYSAQRYYSPARSQGTLQCYYQHAHHSDPYRAIGRQDITAHVNFTALEKQGDRCGLQTVGFTQQALFLMALGLGDRIAALSHEAPSEMGERSLQPASPETGSLQDILRRRESLHALMNPMGVGNFGVLVQSKGLSEVMSQSLKGLITPPLF